LEKAERPILMVGGGAQHAHAELLAFAEKTGLPVITTLMGLGAFPGNHPLWLGMPGMHGTVAANRAIHHADVILAIGLRFDDRVTGKVSRFAPHAHTIIHVDIDPAEIGKVVRTHIPIVGDSRLVLKEMLKGAKPLRLAAWWRELEEWRTRYPLRYRPKPHLQSQEVIRAFHEATGGNAIVTTGVGQHQMFAAQYFTVTRPRSFLTSGGLGTMGVGLPFAIGAQIARPEELVIDFDGDGSFQMTLQELATVVKYRLPVKVVILNNGYLGMVRQWQDLFHAKRYSEVYLADSNPDFAKLAEAYGIKGVRVERKEDLKKGVEAVLNADGPVVAEFKVYQEEGVFPMIPAGGAAEDMILEHPEEEEVGA
jgi:acetolactate synthase-1/2/3 large subunit